MGCLPCITMLRLTLFISALLILADTHPVAQQDPNDDAEVFSGPINSGAGDYGDYEDYGDYHYRSFFPRVRVLVIPVAHASSNSDYEDYSPARPSLSPLLTLLTSMLGGASASTGNDEAATSSEDSADCLLCSVWE